MSGRLLAGLAAACAVGAAGVVVAGGPGAAAHPPPGCVFWRVHSLGDLGLSVLTKVRLSDGAMDRVGVLGYRIDALGHAPGSPLSYGLASRGLTGPFADGAHVITIDAKGTVRDLGPVRGPGLPADRLVGATAGAIHRGDLVVRDGPVLYAIDLDPRSPSYLGLARTTELRPYELARTVDDFDVRDGMLYGVSSHATYYGKVVQIDPLTGRVSYAHGPKLPAGRPYGAALIGPDGALYAAADRITGRSRFYRVDGHGVRPIAVWPGVDSADATGCVTIAPAVPPPPVGGPTATNTRPPEPGQAPTQSNTIPPAPGHGPPQSNTIPPAPGQGPPQSNTIPPAPGQGAPQSNTRPQSPGAGPPMSNVLPPMPEISGSVEITLFPPPPGTTGPTATNIRPPTPPVAPPIPPPPPSPTAPPTTPIPPPPPRAAAPQPPAPPAPKRPKFRRAEAAAPPAMDNRADSTEKKRRWGVAVLVMVLGAGAAAGRVRHR